MTDDELESLAAYAARLADSFYQSFLENLGDEVESIKNLYGEEAGEMFLGCVRESFRDIDF